MNISLFIARRLHLKGSKKESSSSSTIIAITGVAIAIIVMVITLCVVLGFKHQIREKIIGFDAQITINPIVTQIEGEDVQTITFTDSLNNILESAIDSNGSTPIIALTLKQPGIIKTADNFAGLIFKGVDNNNDLSFITRTIVEGTIPNFAIDSCKNKILISSNTASALNIYLGEKINTYFFSNGNIRTRKFEIAGIYNSNFSDYDNKIAFAPLSTLQRIAQIDSISGSSIEITGIDNDKIEAQSIKIQKAINNAVYNQSLNNLYQVDNVLHSGAMYFNWLDLLDTNVVVILILMSCVAGFTLISCLFIIILERIKTIGLLKAIGATNAQVRSIFIHMAQRLIIRGMFIGNITSLSFVFIQERFHLIPLDPNAYYLSFVPIEINWLHIALLNICVIVISSIVLILPSHLASTISPSQTMRYE